MFDFDRTIDAFRELDAIRDEVSRVFFGHGRPMSRSMETPAVNIWKSEDGLVLTADLPGLSADNLDVSVEGDSVTIRGDFGGSGNDANEEATFHRRERLHGRFSRTLSLPYEVDGDKTEATYEKGVLTLQLARPESTKPRKVTVQAV